MAPLRYLLPAIAAAGIASAASCSADQPLTIQNQGDATSELGSCTSFTGSINIRSNFAGPLDLGSLRSITGDLTVKTAPNITGISGGSLENINGKFSLSDAQNLAGLTFPKLTRVGSIEFAGLPNLNTLNWGGPLKEATNVNIENTFLQSLDGINLQKVRGILVANNKLLQALSFQVTQIDGDVIITNNGDRLDVKFPNLQTVRNLTFRNVPKIQVNSLKNVSGNLGFYDNAFEELSTVNLTLVGGTLAINGNTKLTNVSLPALKDIKGGFQLQNNTELDSVEFPVLANVGGAVDFYGNFKGVKFPALKDVHGGFNLQSKNTDISADCDAYKKQSGSSSVIKGKFTCTQTENPGNSTTSSGSKKPSAASTSAPSVTFATIGGLLVAALLTLL